MLVSVIITTFNHSKFIKECLDSVLQNDYSNMEIIISDSASTDGTLDIVRQYDDSRIKIVALERNLGPSYVINKGIEASTGEYIAFISGDDVSMPNRISEQLAYLKSNHDCSIVFCKPIIIDEHSVELKFHDYGNLFITHELSRIELLKRFFYTGNFLCAPSAFMKREMIERVGLFDERFVRLQDFDYWIRAVIAGYKLPVLEQPLVKYRVHSNNLSAQDAWLDCIDKKFIMKNFLSLSREDLLLMFPDPRYQSFKDSTYQAPIVIALAALESKVTTVMEFGIDTLFEGYTNEVFKAELEDNGVYLFELLRKYAMNNAAYMNKFRLYCKLLFNVLRGIKKRICLL